MDFGPLADSRTLPSQAKTTGQSAKVKDDASKKDEKKLWYAIRNSASINELENYLRHYPSGEFAPEAKEVIKAMKAQEAHIDLCLVPIGTPPRTLLDEIAAYYETTLGFEVAVADPLQPLPHAYDPDRRQLVAEELIADVQATATHDSLYRTGVIVGITSEDMHIREYDWHFAFSYRSGGRFAVVSGARMDPQFFGDDPNDELLLVRIRKMVTKNIATLYYDLPMNEDPNSVLYRHILSLGDLDNIDESTVTRDVIEAAARHPR